MEVAFMLVLLDRCCGLDIHKELIFACCLSGDSDSPTAVHSQFAANQNGLSELCNWLKGLDCVHVAMESTGVYWRPVYETLEDQFPECEAIVINAQHFHNLPGRKSDVKDAEWIATMYRHGLLSKSFIPAKAFRTMREVSRLVRKAVSERIGQINRMEKFLQIRDIKLSSVVHDITGKSSRVLLERLVQKGHLTLPDIESICGRLKASPQEIRDAIKGTLPIYDRKLLSRILYELDFYDSEIKELRDILLELAEPYSVQLKQLCSIPGINVDSALAIMAEISATPQTDFASSEKLCSWAGLVPRNDESAGKIISNRILPGNPFIKSILCQCAWVSVYSRNSVFHDWFWKRQARIGRKKAIIAVARKMLALCYKLLTSGEFYDPVVALSPYQSPRQ